MSSSLAENRIILISGANKGIGYETAKLLSQQLPQSTLLLGTRSLDNGQKAIHKMKVESAAATFDNVKAVELDVTDKASIDRAVEVVRAEYGRLDVLVCNAGVGGGCGETAETIFAVNVDGVHDMIEAFLPLIPSATGLINVVASEVGTWTTHARPAELQKVLTSPQSLTWPLVQQLESDWLKAHRGEEHEHPWGDTHSRPTGAYTSSKSLVIAYSRSFALQHEQPKLVMTCPRSCATDFNHHRGMRPAAVGGESVAWPILHQLGAEHGQFYQDGKVHPFVLATPDWALEAYKKYAEYVAAQAAAQAQ